MNKLLKEGKKQETRRTMSGTTNTMPLKPEGRRFNDFAIAIKLKGYSSSSICHYVAGTPGVVHVTPGAYMDYLQGNSWETIYRKVKALVDEHGIDQAAKIMHEEKFGNRS